MKYILLILLSFNISCVSTGFINQGKNNKAGNNSSKVNEKQTPFNVDSTTPGKIICGFPNYPAFSSRTKQIKKGYLDMYLTDFMQEHCNSHKHFSFPDKYFVCCIKK